MSEEELKDINKLVDEVIDDDNLDTWDNLSPFEKATMMKNLLKENKELQKRVKVSQNFAKIVERDYIDKDIIKKLIEDKKQIGTYNIEYLKIEDIKELLGE